MAYLTIRVPREPKKPFSIRKKGNNNAWLCANTANVNRWHFANSPGNTGVTEYSTEIQAKKAIEKFKNSEHKASKASLEVVRFKE